MIQAAGPGHARAGPVAIQVIMISLVGDRPCGGARFGLQVGPWTRLS